MLVQMDLERALTGWYQDPSHPGVVLLVRGTLALVLLIAGAGLAHMVG